MALVLLVIGLVLIGVYVTTRPKEPTTIVRPVSPHVPIQIEVDGDFTTIGAGHGCECVRSGSGSEQDPYLISDWVVNSTRDANAISMFGTTVYVTFRSIQVHGEPSSTGVYFESVENTRIERSLISNSFVGVYVFQSRNIVLFNNTFAKDEYGVQLESSDNNQVSLNSFHEIKMVAIFVRGSSNFVTANRIFEGVFGGINIDGTAGPANDNIIENNTVTGCSTYGIAMWRGAHNTIRNNIVTETEGIGIGLTEGSVGNLVEGNVVTGNIDGGIVMGEGATQNMIRGNTAKGNGDGINYFDLRDTSSDNIWQNNTYETKKPETIS